MMKLEELKIAVYADGADISGMLEMRKKSYIKGFSSQKKHYPKSGTSLFLLRFSATISTG